MSQPLLRSAITADTLKAPTSPEHAVQASLSALSYNILHLEENLNMLAHRLAPVLRIEELGKAAADEDRTSMTAPLADEIRNQADRVGRLHSQVCRILDLLEL